MKNILKKLGVFALICGILSPFASFPKVNAAGDCDHYLNQYLFLDVTNGTDWEHYTKSKGYRTYTTFAYAFPAITSSQTLTIEKVGNVDLIDSEFADLDKFYDAYESLLADGVKDRMLEKQSEMFGYTNEYKYYNNVSNTNKFASVTHLLHGYWGYDDERAEKADYGDLKDTLAKTYKDNTIQGVIISKSEKENSKVFELNDIEITVDYSGASFDGRSFKTKYNNFSDDIDMVSYFQQIVNDFNKGLPNDSVSAQSGYLWKNDDASDTDTFNMNIGIQRKIGSKTDLNKLKFGYTNTDNNKKMVWTMTNPNGNTDNLEIKNSYTALKNYHEYCYDNDKDNVCDGNEANTIDNTQPANDYCKGTVECYLVEGDYDIDTRIDYYWPALLNVEYSVCDNVTADPNNPGQPSTGEWTLKYNKNTSDSVANMPSPDYTKATYGSEIEVTSKVPTRKGYTFKEWCTNENGSGDCYKSGKKVGNSENKATVNLYAHWVEEGTTDDKKLGVVSYVLGFAAVGVVAGGIYLVSKKKNLFKQI